jgi:ATP dependent DNA ligase-like protein
VPPKWLTHVNKNGSSRQGGHRPFGCGAKARPAQRRQFFLIFLPLLVNVSNSTSHVAKVILFSGKCCPVWALCPRASSGHAFQYQPSSRPLDRSACLIKRDGFHLIARKTGSGVKLYSPPGNELTERFPLIVEAVANLRSHSCIVDGEAVACGPDGLPASI